MTGGNPSGDTAPTRPPGADWAADLEAKYGMALEQIPGSVYVFHYDVPQRVKSVSRDYAGPNAVPGPGGLVSAKPIRHYVG